MTNFKPSEFNFNGVVWACREYGYTRVWLSFVTGGGACFPFESIFSGEIACNNSTLVIDPTAAFNPHSFSA